MGKGRRWKFFNDENFPIYGIIYYHAMFADHGVYMYTAHDYNL